MNRPDLFEAGSSYFLATVMVVVCGWARVALSAAGFGAVAAYSFNMAAMAIFVLLPAMRVVGRRSTAFLRTNSPDGRLVALSAVAAAASVYMMAHTGVLLTAAFEAVGYSPLSGVIAPRGGYELAVYAFNAVAVAGVCEEILMRGTVLSAMEVKGSGRAIVLSAILFAVMHGAVENLIQSFVAGLILGFLAVATNSLACSITFHMTYNALSIAMSFMSEDWYNALFAEGYMHSAVCVVIMALIVAGLLAAVRACGKGEFSRNQHQPIDVKSALLFCAGAASMLCLMAVNIVRGVVVK